MATINNYFYVSDSSVGSNPVDEEVFQRARSEEIVGDLEDAHQYYPPI